MLTHTQKDLRDEGKVREEAGTMTKLVGRSYSTNFVLGSQPSSSPWAFSSSQHTLQAPHTVSIHYQM